DAKLTTKEFGRLVGITESRVSQLESDERSGVSASVAKSFEKVGFVGVSGEWSYKVPKKLLEAAESKSPPRRGRKSNESGYQDPIVSTDREQHLESHELHLPRRGNLEHRARLQETPEGVIRYPLHKEYE